MALWVEALLAGLAGGFCGGFIGMQAALVVYRWERRRIHQK